MVEYYTVTLRNGKIRILVIEGEPGVAMMAAYLLTWADCAVQTAWNAERGMKLAQTREFDLITLDMNMPGGFEICSSLKEILFSKLPTSVLPPEFVRMTFSGVAILVWRISFRNHLRHPILSRAFCLTPDRMKKLRVVLYE